MAARVGCRGQHRQFPRHDAPIRPGYGPSTEPLHAGPIEAIDLSTGGGPVAGWRGSGASWSSMRHLVIALGSARASAGQEGKIVEGTRLPFSKPG